MNISTMSDRDRLLFAFDDLRQQGYTCPNEFAFTICCMSCGLAELEQMGVDEEDGFVFWHQQKDDYAFCGDREFVPSKFAYMDEEELLMIDEEAWNEECWLEKSEKFNKLVNSLHLHWGGDADVIVAALQKWGLDAVVPEDINHCIEVRP